MLSFFMFLLFFGIGVNIINRFKVPQEADCIAHKWYWDEQDIMRCKVCHKRPGGL